MTTADAAKVAEPAAAEAGGRRHPLRGVVGAGLLATGAAMAYTTLVAALARAAGVDLEVPEGGEVIPVEGITVVTGVFSLVGVVLAVVLLRWSARPAVRFVWVTVSLTAISLLPPLLVGADAGTTLTLVALHLLAAAVVIPILAHRLATP